LNAFIFVIFQEEQKDIFRAAKASYT